MSAASGMVAASHPLAVEAAVAVLEQGGTAADAAVAAAAMLTVVDPRSTGIGGDLFALYWEPGADRPVGLAAAGGAPAGMTVQALREQGFDQMPPDGPWTVTVPGATWGWTALLDRYGRLGSERILRPAIETARNGFTVAPVIAEEWRLGVDKLRRHPDAAAVFLPDGHVPEAGDTFVNPGLADALECFVAEGHQPFYTGTPATGFADAVGRLGGPLQVSDLSNWAGPEWSAPISRPFRGVDVYEMPPPGQGLVVLEGARLYEGLKPGLPGRQTISSSSASRSRSPTPPTMSPTRGSTTCRSRTFSTRTGCPHCVTALASRPPTRGRPGCLRTRCTCAWWTRRAPRVL